VESSLELDETVCGPLTMRWAAVHILYEVGLGRCGSRSAYAPLQLSPNDSVDAWCILAELHGPFRSGTTRQSRNTKLALEPGSDPLAVYIGFFRF